MSDADEIERIIDTLNTGGLIDREDVAVYFGHLTARIAALEKAQQDSSSALEAIVLEALGPYGEELTIGQRRMLADVIAREFRARTTLEASERGGGE